METMTTAFSARPSVQLDSMIVYSGPPAAKPPKIRPPKPAPAPQTRDDSVPPVAMRPRRAGVVENDSGPGTSNGDNCNDFTSAIATFTLHEAACCSGPLDTSIPTETYDYRSIADMALGTARWPDLWGNVANNVCTCTAAGSAPNEATHPSSCWTIDVQCVCASAMSSAAALAEPQQRTRDELEMCTPVRYSPSPEVLSKSPSQAVMRAHAYSADNAAPADGNIGRDRPSALVRTDYDDTPVAVHPAMHDLPDETSWVCVALGAQPHQLSTLVGRELQDEHWAHDQYAVRGDSATLVLAGDHSCSASDQANSLHHETIRAGRGASIAEEPGSACEENKTCVSSDDDIVPWIPKRRRALPVGCGSTERRDQSHPSMKRKRRQIRTAEHASRSAQCCTAASQISSRPTSRRHHVAAARSRPQKNISPTSTSTQDEGPVPPRALGFECEPTWEVDRIVGSAHRHGKVFYKVRWEPTWEPAESLQGSADAAVAEFRLSNRRRRLC